MGFRKRPERPSIGNPIGSPKRLSFRRALLIALAICSLLSTSVIFRTVVRSALYTFYGHCSVQEEGERRGLGMVYIAHARDIQDGRSGSVRSDEMVHKEGRQRTGPPRFLLYRLIGNNMPPLQCYGQLLKNTRFALDHEPDLPGCKKKWVLNNIINRTEQARLLDLLVSRGYTMEDIIIRRINYSRVATFPRERWTSVVTAQNEARNEIIQDGVAAGARWILAFDGNQFYTREAWASIVAAADRWEEQGLKYFKVPMYRLYREQNSRWLKADTKFQTVRQYAPLLWESQLAFRNDSDARYVQGVMYGRDNKLELLDRVCGTGAFNETKRKRSRQESAVDTGLCGCHREVGNDRKQREIKNEVALQCGYSIRLWYHPCASVNASRIFVDRKYRAGLRDKGHRMLTADIVRQVEQARKSVQ